MILTGDLNVWRDETGTTLPAYDPPAQPWQANTGTIGVGVRSGPDGDANRIAFTGSLVEVAVKVADSALAGDTFTVDLVGYCKTLTYIGLANTPYPNDNTASASNKIIAQNVGYAAMGTHTLIAPDTGGSELWLTFRASTATQFAIMEANLTHTPATPPPDPDPVDPPTPPVTGLPARVAAFMGQGDDTELVALAVLHVPVVQAMAKAYTRGGGFNAFDDPFEDVEAVITTASARLLANPEQIEYALGGVTYRGGFVGWSLAEQFVLNRYRKRAL